MQEFIQFCLRHWELCLTFIVVLSFLLVFELHGKLTGVPSVSPQEVTRLINHEDAVVIDIRDSASFSKGHIINAINIPQAELEAALKRIEKYKERTVVLVYNMGQPHHKAINLLRKAGFTKLYHLKGGITTWQNASLPLTKK